MRGSKKDLVGYFEGTEVDVFIVFLLAAAAAAAAAAAGAAAGARIS